MKAFSNIKGTFNGGYQFNKSNMENIVLWGLIQEDNQEIKDFCKNLSVRAWILKKTSDLPNTAISGKKRCLKLSKVNIPKRMH